MRFARNVIIFCKCVSYELSQSRNAPTFIHHAAMSCLFYYYTPLKHPSRIRPAARTVEIEIP